MSAAVGQTPGGPAKVPWRPKNRFVTPCSRAASKEFRRATETVFKPDRRGAN